MVQYTAIIQCSIVISGIFPVYLSEAVKIAIIFVQRERGLYG